MYTTPVWHSMKIEISEMTVKYSARIRLKPTSTMATYRPDQSIRNNVSPLYFDEITFIARVHRRSQCHRYTQRRTWWIAPLGSIQSRRRRRTEPKKWFMAQCTSDLSPCVWNARLVCSLLNLNKNLSARKISHKMVHRRWRTCERAHLSKWLLPLLFVNARGAVGNCVAGKSKHRYGAGIQNQILLGGAVQGDAVRNADKRTINRHSHSSIIAYYFGAFQFWQNWDIIQPLRNCVPLPFDLPIVGGKLESFCSPLR